MDINYDTARPIYKQIMEYIIRKLATGELEAGEKLPSQRDMAQKLEVNPNTVQRAYREMENRRLIETRRGVGTFITESREKIEEVSQELSEKIISEFIEQMRLLNFTNQEIIELVKKNLFREE
ncbi:MAG: GntR family transcriptional regulator [Bacillota bacterium]